MTIFTVLGRILLSSIFLLGGMYQLFHRAASEQLFMNGMLELLGRVYQFPGIQRFFDQLITHSSFVVILGTIMELIGAFLVLLGIQVRLGACLLLLFLIPVTLLLHPFWMISGSMHELQMIMFFKNISIMGGCLILIGCSEGASSSYYKKGRRK